MATLPAVPTFQAAGTSQSGTGALTVAWPTHATNDIALLVVDSQNEAITLTTAAGFVQVTGSPQSSGSQRLAVFWCRATSAAMTSPVVAANTLNKYARIYTFRSCATTGTPYVVAAGGTNGTGTSPSIAGTTTLQQNTLVAAIIGYQNTSTTPQASGWTNANLASVTQQGDESTALGGGIALATGSWAAGGAYGATTLTLANSITYSCISLAFKPTWFIDAASGKAFPQNVGEYASVYAADATGVLSDAPTPNSIYLQQEASGNLADSGPAGLTLTKAGTVTYNAAVAGYTATGLSISDNVQGDFFSTNSALPDMRTQSLAVLQYALLTSTTGGRPILIVGGSGEFRTSLTLTGGNTRLEADDIGNGATGTTDPTGQVRPYMNVISAAASQQTLYSNAEALSPTWAAGTSATKTFIIGGNASTKPPAATLMYTVNWFTTNAEYWTALKVRRLLEMLNWSPTWAITRSSTISMASDSSTSLVGIGAGIGALSAPGDSSTSLVGASLARGVLAAAGDSSASIVGSSLAAGILSAPGSSTFSTIGSSLASGALSAPGDSTTGLVGAALATGSWDVIGDSTASLVGASLASGGLAWTPNSIAMLRGVIGAVAVVGSSGGTTSPVSVRTVSAQPFLPPWRQIHGTTGSALTDIREVLAAALAQQHLWGNHVDVTFTAASTPTRVVTNLGGTPKGYKVVRSDADVRVWDATPPTITTDRGVLWLQASGAANITLYVY